MRVIRTFAVVLLLGAVAAGCGDDEGPVAAGAGGGTTEPGRSPADVTTSSTAAPSPDEPAPTSTSADPGDGPFAALMTDHCRRVFDGIAALDEPETVGGVRTLMAEAVRLHHEWLDVARDLVPPGVVEREWGAQLDRLGAALVDIDAYMAELTAGRPDSEPVDELYLELSSPEGMAVDRALNLVLWDLNELAGLDCFDVEIPED